MKDQYQLSPEMIYRLVAEIGFRRHFHLGGFEATYELLERCRLGRDMYVLDVGCASGKTACYIAKRYGCQVVGVDILERMIDRANERAKREHVQNQMSFRIADARELPFENDLFDVVVGEFITGLLDDKWKGISGYVRVVKPGGHVGLNEATWLKTPPPRELQKYLSVVFGVKWEIPSAEGWVELLERAGLNEVEARVCKADSLSSSWEDLKDVARFGHRVLYQYIRSGAFRRFIKETLSVPGKLLEHFGYGIYIGMKGERLSD